MARRGTPRTGEGQQERPGISKEDAIWNAIETSDIDIADASDRIKEHRERKERLWDATANARAILSQRRAYVDDVSTIAAYAGDLKDFLQRAS